MGSRVCGLVCSLDWTLKPGLDTCLSSEGAPLVVTTMIMPAMTSSASLAAHPSTASLVLIGLLVKSRMKSYT